MKKKTIWIVVMVMVIMIAMITGCSAHTDPAAPVPPEGSSSAAPEGSAAPEETEGAQSPGSPDTESVENAGVADDGEAVGVVPIFGKVKRIVGNEIELELAKPPFDIAAPGTGAAKETEGGGTPDSYVKSETRIFTEGDNGAVIMDEEAKDSSDASEQSDEKSMTYFATGQDGQVHVFGGEDGEKMELDYTGESKSILIPAGVDIVSLAGEATIDAVKKGSVLMLMVDESSGTPMATSLTIME